MHKKEFGFLLLGAAMVLTAAACSDSGSACGAAVAREDYQKAFSLCLPLAQQGDTEAQNDLGYMYDQGRGVAQDYARAIDWYRKAAEGGYSVAQINLGLMYENGLGVRKDNVQACKWYFVALAQGDAEALQKIAQLRDKMPNSKMEEAQKLAKDWLQKRQ